MIKMQIQLTKTEKIMMGLLLASMLLDVTLTISALSSTGQTSLEDNPLMRMFLSTYDFNYAYVLVAVGFLVASISLFVLNKIFVKNKETVCTSQTMGWGVVMSISFQGWLSGLIFFSRQYCQTAVYLVAVLSSLIFFSIVFKVAINRIKEENNTKSLNTSSTNINYRSINDVFGNV